MVMTGTTAEGGAADTYESIHPPAIVVFEEVLVRRRKPSKSKQQSEQSKDIKVIYHVEEEGDNSDCCINVEAYHEAVHDDPDNFQHVHEDDLKADHGVECDVNDDDKDIGVVDKSQIEEEEGDDSREEGDDDVVYERKHIFITDSPLSSPPNTPDRSDNLSWSEDEEDDNDHDESAAPQPIVMGPSSRPMIPNQRTRKEKKRFGRPHRICEHELIRTPPRRYHTNSSAAATKRNHTTTSPLQLHTKTTARETKTVTVTTNGSNSSDSEQDKTTKLLYDEPDGPLLPTLNQHQENSRQPCVRNLPQQQNKQQTGGLLSLRRTEPHVSKQMQPLPPTITVSDEAFEEVIERKTSRTTASPSRIRKSPLRGAVKHQSFEEDLDPTMQEGGGGRNHVDELQILSSLSAAGLLENETSFKKNGCTNQRSPRTTASHLPLPHRQRMKDTHRAVSAPNPTMRRGGSTSPRRFSREEGSSAAWSPATSAGSNAGSTDEFYSRFHSRQAQKRMQQQPSRKSTLLFEDEDLPDDERMAAKKSASAELDEQQPPPNEHQESRPNPTSINDANDDGKKKPPVKNDARTNIDAFQRNSAGNSSLQRSVLDLPIDGLCSGFAQSSLSLNKEMEDLATSLSVARKIFNSEGTDRSGDNIKISDGEDNMQAPWPGNISSTIIESGYCGAATSPGDALEVVLESAALVRDGWSQILQYRDRTTQAAIVANAPSVVDAASKHLLALSDPAAYSLHCQQQSINKYASPYPYPQDQGGQASHCEICPSSSDISSLSPKAKTILQGEFVASSFVADLPFAIGQHQKRIADLPPSSHSDKSATIALQGQSAQEMNATANDADANIPGNGIGESSSSPIVIDKHDSLIEEEENPILIDKNNSLIEEGNPIVLDKNHSLADEENPIVIDKHDSFKEEENPIVIDKHDSFKEEEKNHIFVDKDESFKEEEQNPTVVDKNESLTEEEQNPIVVVKIGSLMEDENPIVITKIGSLMENYPTYAWSTSMKEDYGIDEFGGKASPIPFLDEVDRTRSSTENLFLPCLDQIRMSPSKFESCQIPWTPPKNAIKPNNLDLEPSSIDSTPASVRFHHQKPQIIEDLEEKKSASPCPPVGVAASPLDEPPPLLLIASSRDSMTTNTKYTDEGETFFESINNEIKVDSAFGHTGKMMEVTTAPMRESTWNQRVECPGESSPDSTSMYIDADEEEIKEKDRDVGEKIARRIRDSPADEAPGHEDIPLPSVTNGVKDCSIDFKHEAEQDEEGSVNENATALKLDPPASTDDSDYNIESHSDYSSDDERYCNRNPTNPFEDDEDESVEGDLVVVPAEDVGDEVVVAGEDVSKDVVVKGKNFTLRTDTTGSDEASALEEPVVSTEIKKNDSDKSEKAESGDSTDWWVEKDDSDKSEKPEAATLADWWVTKELAKREQQQQHIMSGSKILQAVDRDDTSTLSSPALSPKESESCNSEREGNRSEVLGSMSPAAASQENNGATPDTPIDCSKEWWITKELARREQLRKEQKLENIRKSRCLLASSSDVISSIPSGDSECIEGRSTSFGEKPKLTPRFKRAPEAASDSSSDLMMTPILTPPVVRRLKESQDESFESMVGLTVENEIGKGGGLDQSKNIKKIDQSNAGSVINKSISLLDKINALVEDLDESLEQKTGDSNHKRRVASPPRAARKEKAPSPNVDRDAIANQTATKAHSPKRMHSEDLPSLKQSRSREPVITVPTKANFSLETTCSKPILVRSLDCEAGIPKGDVMISLLNEDGDTTWAARVHEAMWRCRSMRQNCDTKLMKEKFLREQLGGPSQGRSSIPVDVDEVRVVGGIGCMNSTQNAALRHMRYDDFNDARALYEDILECYNQYFVERLKRQNGTGLDAIDKLNVDVNTFKLFISQGLHNVGIIYALEGKFGAALTYFERAMMNRATSLGSSHIDHISSMVRMAMCHFAMEDFKEAHSLLNEALALSRGSIVSLGDHYLLAEILNNLGCLFYLDGGPDEAMALFEESLQVQSFAAEHSLYVGSKYASQQGSLNASITRGNIGFLTLVKRDISQCLSCFEASLKAQQLLLKEAHVTLLCTMDHLVVANLLAERKDKALQLLRRMLCMQLEAFGSKDNRCVVTENKILMLEGGQKSIGLERQHLDDTHCSISTGDKRKPQSPQSRFLPFRSLLGRR